MMMLNLFLNPFSQFLVFGVPMWYGDLNKQHFYVLAFQSQKQLYNRKCLSICQSVCLSVRLKSKPLSLSESSLSVIMHIYWSLIHISHHANQLPCPPPPPQPLCQVAIIHIPIRNHHAYWPLYLSANCPAFVTSKPFRLVSFKVAMGLILTLQFLK